MRVVSNIGLTVRNKQAAVMCMSIQQPFLYASPFPKQHNLDSSKLKGFADGNFEFDENDRKVSKRVENTVGTGGIARYEQFLLFPQRFHKTCTADT